MTEFTEKALVLKAGRFREADVWVRLFTPSRGALTAFAFGGSRSRRRFCGCLDPLSETLVTVKADRGGRYLTLQEGTLLRSFPGLRRDLKRLGHAVNCLKFVEATQLGPQGAQQTHALLLQTLTLLDDGPALGEEALELLPLFFRARSTFAQGLAPELTACHDCGRPIREGEGVSFFVEAGHLCCRPCAGRRPEPPLAMGAEAVETLAFVASAPPPAWPALVPTRHARREIYVFVERFVRCHLGLTWDNGRFERV